MIYTVKLVFFWGEEGGSFFRPEASNFFFPIRLVDLTRVFLFVFFFKQTIKYVERKKKSTGKLVRYFDTRRRLDKRVAIFHFIVSRVRPSYILHVYTHYTAVAAIITYLVFVKYTIHTVNGCS